MKCIIITVGDEILIGQIVDSNSAWIGQQLNAQGLRIEEILSVGDMHQAIIDAIQYAFTKVDIVLMTGGLGPTKDDITKKAIADYLGVSLSYHPPTWEWIQQLFANLGRPTKEVHKVQAYLPEGCEALQNKMGTAPGMWCQQGSKILVSMPGVPYEMKYIMEYGVLPRLKTMYAESVVLHRTLLTSGLGETDIAERIAPIEDALPAHIKLAYLPALGEVRLRFTGIGSRAQATTLQQQLADCVKAVQACLPEYIYGYDTDTLESIVAKLLVAQGKKLGLAESCTGGSLSQRLTANAGASAYFEGSVVAYSYEVKTRVLGVSADTLAQHGAVSEATVRAMVQGALRALQVDVAVAISGIAGPDGGTPEKPVGTIWIAVGDAHHTVTRLLQGRKDRQLNIQYAGNVALNMLRKLLMN